MEVHPTAIVDPAARLGEGSQVGAYAVIGPEVELGRLCRVGSHAVLQGPLKMGEGNSIHSHAVIGGDPQDQKYMGERSWLVIGDGNVFREFSTANRGTEGGGGRTAIGCRNLFMAYSHVAHDCRIGDDVVLANGVALAGHVEIGNGAIIGGLSAVHQNARIGELAMVSGGSMVAQDVPPFTIAQGDRARLRGLNRVGLRRHGIAASRIDALQQAYTALFRRGQRREKAIRILMEEATEETSMLLAFLQASQRGICKAHNDNGE
jgi:UDP-N-acetylglucosamine acyltransferase